MATSTLDVTEGAALAEELRNVWRGEAWHGPALEQVLEGVSPELAAARPVPAGHSIWELVLHLAAWADVVRRRLDGDAVGDPEEGDFPPVPAATGEEWARARAKLDDAYRRLTERVTRLAGSELGAKLPHRDYSARFLVRGAVCHTVYHSGQIGLLRKSIAG
jgi:uncharacterized damage-inducible protein DinB